MANDVNAFINKMDENGYKTAILSLNQETNNLLLAMNIDIEVFSFLLFKLGLEYTDKDLASMYRGVAHAIEVKRKQDEEISKSVDKLLKSTDLK